MDSHNDLNPAVSVAMCTYNGATYIGQQLESIFTQSYPNIAEIVCVDDGSTDNTIAVLEQYQKQDSRIRIVQNTSNLGYIKNFEKALTLATSPFIALADQDDIWYPKKVEKLMTTIGNRLMVYSDTEYIDEGNRKLGKKISDFRKLGECYSCLNLALFNGISGHTMIVRKELVQQAIPFSLDVPHDYWMAFFAGKYGSIAFVDEALVGYRQHTNNALGGIGTGGKKIADPYIEPFNRITAFANSLDNQFIEEKRIIEELADTFHDITFRKRFKKVRLFLKYREPLLFFKKRNKFRKLFYCFKMFWRVI